MHDYIIISQCRFSLIVITPPTHTSKTNLARETHLACSTRLGNMPTKKEELGNGISTKAKINYNSN